MAIQFLFFSFLVFLFNDGVFSYDPYLFLTPSSIPKAPSYDTERQSSYEKIVFDVDHYGVKADGTDNSEAFKRAWEAACSSTSHSSVLLVPPHKTYLLKPLELQGPCEAKNITVMIKGNLKAPSERADWSGEDVNYWIKFKNVRHLTVKGGGELDGSGQIWWQNSCKINKSAPCLDAPTALVFHRCEKLRVSDLTIRDSQKFHVVFSKCANVKAFHLTIRAPQWSPNTDGIHVTGTQDIMIFNCFIGTGDDCISIVKGSKNVYVKDIVCGPGHGISIGSLGKKNSEAHVSNVVVEKATLIGTTNGVRIKTWQGGYGYAENIVFQDIFMTNVSNPIIINQHYCDSRKPCYQQNAAVAVRGVRYKNIRGTSATDISVNFNCSSTC
ncbi:Pectin lyase-like superfamily protein [Rhynchospora pubera]|uniref:endo-polygalacturonase n=1 Tax=Rhynchospora pubera TaxID=906938 RepID=A0AAV8HW93_9POAL|nr:Pectin lyase-like superfamily protein [Rhynchospora pubera]